MNELADLYQEVILDHNRRPRNFRAMDPAARKAEGHNPLCGDRVTVFLEMDGDRVRDISFQGSGCAISKASASMMTESLKGKTREEAEALFRVFHSLVTEDHPDPDRSGSLGKLVVFSGVREFPVRVKCATLALHTLHAALAKQTQPVSTE